MQDGSKFEGESTTPKKDPVLLQIFYEPSRAPAPLQAPNPSPPLVCAPLDRKRGKKEKKKKKEKQ
jgi:hypothetical protein